MFTTERDQYERVVRVAIETAIIEALQRTLDGDPVEDLDARERFAMATAPIKTRVV